PMSARASALAPNLVVYPDVILGTRPLLSSSRRWLPLTFSADAQLSAMPAENLEGTFLQAPSFLCLSQEASHGASAP
ncbi:hypothetical protein, partial [Rhizobium sp. Pop5]|uniref:hypothetical protein n=1 Tax=Rhizobium sp. Pop5 TaxID=1223565 RepID=UPI00196A12BF